jgi:AcrR family transcriptional regulator
MSDTKERILDVAERLFAEQGFANTSLRHIITEAGVNLAAVHYHFGSKEELLDELIRRRADPINQARIEMLDRLESESEGRPLPVEAILQAFLEPGLKAAAQHPSMIRFVGRLHAEGTNLSILRKHFEPVARRFISSLRRSVPDLSEAEFMMRLRYLAGAMAFSVQDERLSAPADAGTVRHAIATLIAFLKGGLLAPATPADAEREQLMGEKIEVEI